MNKKIYCISVDGETFSGEYNSIEEALEEAFVGYDYSEVYVAEASESGKASQYIYDNTIISLLEIIGENAYEVVGEVGGDWLQPPKFPYQWLKIDDSKKEKMKKEWDDWNNKIKQLKEEVSKILDIWCDKYNLHPTFYHVKNINFYLKRDWETKNAK